MSAGIERPDSVPDEIELLEARPPVQIEWEDFVARVRVGRADGFYNTSAKGLWSRTAEFQSNNVRLGSQCVVM